VEPSQEILERLLTKSVWTSEEQAWMLEYLQETDQHALRQLMQEKFEQNQAEPTNLPIDISERLLAQIHEQINATPVRAPKLYWKKWLAAAAMVILVAAAAFLYLQSKQVPPVPVAGLTLKQDIAPPSSNTAIITLGNGQQIILDSAGKGLLAMEGNVQLTKTADGSIVYQGASDKYLVNTLNNPRGSKPITLVLSDGSKVWLNSESSLRYPVAFGAAERQVEITGEAYFEVAKKAQPFKVAVAGKGVVEVLGTHFNINSYQDETYTKVTLLEGSVKVYLQTNGAAEAIAIKPGQQALYLSDQQKQTAIQVKNNIDLSAIVAWKNGYFNFDNSDLKSVLRQLSRWYNVDVVYQGNIPKRVFGGEMQRDLNLSEVLKILEKNNVHFKIETDKLIVMP
jgi:ferric-dicitrate binding protein FerR (iron transport regulator)